MTTPVSVSWDFPAVQEPLIDSFRIKYGATQGGPYDQNVLVSDKTARQFDLSLESGAKYYAVVVALSGGAEVGPEPDSEVEIDLVATFPTNFRLT